MVAIPLRHKKGVVLIILLQGCFVGVNIMSLSQSNITLKGGLLTKRQFPEKWSWMMDYCKSQRIPPAQSWAWDKAKDAYVKNFPQSLEF